MALISRCRVRLAAVAATAFVAAPMLVASPTTTGAAPPEPVLRPAAMTSLALAQREDRFAARILTLVNRKREHHHLRKVRAQTCVSGFSDHWAGRLARRNVLVHSNLDRLLSSCSAAYASENLAEIPPGYTPRAVVRLWMHSPAHRHNILSRRPTASGVGVRWDPDQGVWLVVQNFARHPHA